MIPVVASRAPPAAASQFSRSCVRLLVLSAVPRPRHPALASRRASPEMTTTPTDNWLPQESIALVDNAPLFSAGEGDHAVTFWQIMADSTPELSARSALECEEHWSRRIELRLEEWTRANERVGPAPPVLKDWTRLDDGRYAGRLSGQPSAVWLTVAKEGRLEIDPRSTPGYIETTEGRIYELAVSTAGAESQRLQPVDGSATPFVVRFPRSPQELVGTGGLIFALSLALGFGMGVADKERALEQLSLSPTATEMRVPTPDKVAGTIAEKPTGASGAQVTRGGAALPAGLVEAKLQAKNSIGQTLATTQSPTAGWRSSETYEKIRGMCYHLPFSDYDLNQAQFDRLSDEEQRRFERMSVPDRSAGYSYVDNETGLAISGARYHLPFTSYDIGQRTFDRLPREEQLRFEKHTGYTGGVQVLIGRDGNPY